MFISMGCFINPVTAAENLIIKVGPLEQSLTVNELEEFADSGKLPSNLQMLSPFFTSNFRDVLNKSVEIDAEVTEKSIDELLESSQAQNLLKQISIAFPDSTIDLIKATLILGIQQTNNVNIINLLKVYPKDNITIDLTAALGLALQFNVSNIQSQLLIPQLEEKLKVETSSNYHTTFDPTILGNEEVSQKTLILRDSERKRLVLTDIYYGDFYKTEAPLIVMSHGFAADRKFLQYLAYHLASYGFIVVAIEHPGSNIYSFAEAGFNLDNLLPESEFIDRPKDVTFVLNELEEFNKNDNNLPIQFNTEKVTIIGHSFGGYTAFALAGAELNSKEMRKFCEETLALGRSPADWLQCSAAKLPNTKHKFKDERIKQLIAFNPIVGNLFGKSISEIKIPSLIFASSKDSITPNLDNQLKPFQELKGNKYLAIGFGATHMSITDKRNEKSPLAQSTIVKEIVGEEAEPVRNFAKAITLAFVEQLTPEADKYKQFLTADYVQHLSSHKINFRWTDNISNQLQIWLNSLFILKQQIVRKPKPSEFNLGFLINRNKYCTAELDNIFTPLLNIKDNTLT